MNIVEKKYMCLEENCGWVGTEEEMDADCQECGGDEIWSNWICPKCRCWHQLKDYKEIKE